MSALIMFFSSPELSLLPSESPSLSKVYSSVFSFTAQVKPLHCPSRCQSWVYCSKIYNVSARPWHDLSLQESIHTVQGTSLWLVFTSFSNLNLISSFPHFSFLHFRFSFLISSFLLLVVPGIDHQTLFARARGAGHETTYASAASAVGSHTCQKQLWNV